MVNCLLSDSLSSTFTQIRLISMFTLTNHPINPTLELFALWKHWTNNAPQQRCLGCFKYSLEFQLNEPDIRHQLVQVSLNMFVFLPWCTAKYLADLWSWRHTICFFLQWCAEPSLLSFLLSQSAWWCFYWLVSESKPLHKLGRLPAFKENTLIHLHCLWNAASLLEICGGS